MLTTLTRRQVGLLVAWTTVQGLAVLAIYVCWTHLGGPISHRAWQVVLPLLCLLALICAAIRMSWAVVDSPHSSIIAGSLIGASAIAALLSAAPGLAWAVGVLMGIFMMLIATATLRALFASDPTKRADAREVLTILTRQAQDSPSTAAPDPAGGGSVAQGQEQGTDPVQNITSPPTPGA